MESTVVENKTSSNWFDPLVEKKICLGHSGKQNHLSKKITLSVKQK
jgi:hypothetical protein